VVDERYNPEEEYIGSLQRFSSVLTKPRTRGCVIDRAGLFSERDILEVEPVTVTDKQDIHQG